MAVVSFFGIPVADLPRAIAFYGYVFAVTLELAKFGASEGNRIALSSESWVVGCESEERVDSQMPLASSQQPAG